MKLEGFLVSRLLVSGDYEEVHTSCMYLPPWIGDSLWESDRV